MTLNPNHTKCKDMSWGVDKQKENIMSLGVALYNDPDTIQDLQLVIKILNDLPDDYELEVNNGDETEVVNYARVLRLSDWLDDIVKILTDFSMFSQEEEYNV
jgi:hypothetical protein